VDDAVLKSVATAGGNPSGAIAGLALKYRAAHKQLSTYVDGIAKNIWPDGKVHCNFNHNVTLTGRLSCSNPNLQNQTDGDIKRVFVPDGGTYIEYDYQQLEVVGLAILSGDAQLTEDIRTGTDIHTALFKDMYIRDPSTAERKAFKPLTFGLIYGAGARTLSENSGTPLSECVRFIAAFYTRYPDVKRYHDEIIEAAKANRTPSALKTEKGYPRGQWVYRLPTGREYKFLEYDNEYGWKGGVTSFSPTELKNWPVQGWSTGDVVPMMMGYVVAEITKSKYFGRIRPVVTVHDSMMFEIDYSVDLTEARNYLDDLMSKTREVIKQQFGYDIGLELKTEGKTGNNWKEMH